MKKVLVCALAALFLMANCLTAFAAPAAADYTTTTTYIVDGDGTTKLSVETTVATTNLTSGDMLTYLAYTGNSATPADADIIYIDQQTYDGSTSPKFAYTTDDANISGVTVKYGASTLATAIEDDYTVRTITVTDGKTNNTVTFPSEVGANASVTTDIVISSNDASYTATLDGADVKSLVTLDGAGKFVINDGAALAGANGKTITIAVESEQEEVAPNYDDTNDKGGMYVGYSNSKLAEKLCLFGIAPAGVTEYGIIITTEYVTDEAFTYDAATGKFAGKAKGSEGQFAVQLVKYMNDADDKELTTGTLKARTYVKGATKYAYGKVYTFTDGVLPSNN